MKKVYAVVVTYNGVPWINKCLSSLQKSKLQCSIICIDNASSDATAEVIINNFPAVHLIKSATNLGFGRANNIGLLHAVKNEADYVFLLNQDAFIEPDTIQKLVELHIKNPRFGIISPLHYNGRGDQLDLYFGKYLFESKFSPQQDAAAILDSKREALISTNFVNAAAWLVTKECIKTTGGFDPIFFHYGEDNNYIQRALFKGFEVGIYTGCRIFHDREQQLNKSATQNKVLKKEWTFFLTNACDINRRGYKVIVLKRFLRHFFMMIKGLLLLKNDVIIFNFKMAKNIFLSVAKIGRSRKLAVSMELYTFLKKATVKEK